MESGEILDDMLEELLSVLNTIVIHWLRWCGKAVMTAQICAPLLQAPRRERRQVKAVLSKVGYSGHT